MSIEYHDSRPHSRGKLREREGILPPRLDLYNTAYMGNCTGAELHERGECASLCITHVKACMTKINEENLRRFILLCLRYH